MSAYVYAYTRIRIYAYTLLRMFSFFQPVLKEQFDSLRVSSVFCTLQKVHLSRELVDALFFILRWQISCGDGA